MNKVILIGHLCAAPDVRYSQGENSMAVARYRLAVDRRYKREDEQNIKGIDEKISNLKTQFPTHFDSENNPGPREIDPKPLPEGDHNNDVQPKNLADALRMQYEDNEK